MIQKTTIHGEALNASQEGTFAVELFLNENYAFRRNLLNGKVEFATKSDADASPQEAVVEAPESTLMWRPLTQEALNSIIRRAKK